MKRLSKHDVNKLSAKALEEQLPFEITSDGEVIAIVWSPGDVTNVTVARHVVNKLTELPLSKKRQTSSVW